MAQENNHKFYKNVVERFGISAKGVHWNSEYSQYKRFEVLTSFIEHDLSNSIIVDAGCGFAEYYNYLFDNDMKPKKYIGIDCEEMMINKASKRFIDTNFYIKNILKDELPIADYYICSGAMNILSKEEVFAFIQNCFNASTKAYIFNFLKSDSFNNVTISQVLKYCKTLTKEIKVKDNYLLNDISIYLKK